MRQRDQLIDVARGIGIMLVVFGHSHIAPLSSPDAVQFIYLFHVPLFFCLSGWIAPRRSPIETARRQAVAILWPYLVVSLIIGCVKAVVRHESWVGMLAGIAWGTGDTLPSSQIWFVPCIYLSSVVAGVLGWFFQSERQLPRWNRTYSAVALLFVLGLLAVGQKWLLQSPNRLLPESNGSDVLGLPWSIDLLPAGVFFIFVGRVMGKCWRNRALVSVLIIFVCAVAMYQIYVSGARVDLNRREMSPFYLSGLAAILGTALVVACAGLTLRISVLAQALAILGRNSLGILFFHIVIQNFLSNLAMTRWSGDVPWFVLAVIVSLMSAMLSLGVWMVMKPGIVRLNPLGG